MPRAVFCLARFIVSCAVFCLARYSALRGLLCLARFIMLCAVCCALRGLLCPARYSALRGILPCTAYCALRGLLCPARLTVPCAAYCALRGLLCPARYSALRGLLCFVRSIVPCAVYCAAMFIYVGVRRTTFMIDKTFCVRQGFSCAERSHRADFARAGARACPCNADTWILSSVRRPWVRQRRSGHKNPAERLDAAPQGK